MQAKRSKLEMQKAIDQTKPTSTTPTREPMSADVAPIKANIEPETSFSSSGTYLKNINHFNTK